MRILFVIENFKLGGKQRRFIELLKGLNEDKSIDYHVLILSNDIHYKEIHTVAKKLSIIQRNSKKDLSLFFKIKRLVNKLKPDLIHTWGSMSSVYVIPSILSSKIKLVNSMIIHATPINYRHEDWARSKITFPFSDVIIANSFAGLDAFKVRKKGTVVHNGFDFRRIEKLEDPQQIETKFHIPTNLIVGMVGAFEDRKDYDLYIKAAIKIASTRNDVTFLAIGNGANLTSTKSKVPAHISSRIIFTGKQSNVESLINIFSIGVLTTNDKIHGEGISNSILEYMALSKPVVATKGGGTAEIVEDNKSGYLINPADEDDLVQKINVLLDNPKKRSEMGKIGHERIKEHFNLNEMSAKYTSIYKKLLE